MEEDETADPLNVGLFGPDAEVTHPRDVAHFIEQTWFRGG
jgi:hypothetical protein